MLEHELPLIIDDFHYIDRYIQKSIVRALKDPLYEGLPIIIIAVSHRSYDALRVEPEMTGRVTQIEIPLWNLDDLITIPKTGFSELNVVCPDSIIDRFANQSFGCPHLMQDFCLKLCIENSLNQKLGEQIELQKPNNYNRFFKYIANSASKPVFDRLARGPRARKDRLVREFVDGSKGDIYLAVLRAIAYAGPKTRLTFEEIRTALQDILADNTPQGNEIAQVLSQMDRIAREKIEGEPVIDWDSETRILHVVDPYLAFYLQWSDQTNISGL